jgi:KDO2-lipid IV(A) lauroyltransferase
MIGYRRKVVFNNLRNSFPEKTEQELTKIAKGFYHHLCDIVVESVKSSGMKELDVAARYRLINPELVDEFYRQNRPLIAVAGHFNNWEWSGIAAGSQMKHKPVGFYKPLSNPYLDEYIRKTRIRGRSALASIKRTTETFNLYKSEPAIFYMVSDQSPSSPRLAYWVQFMNQETATLHGPEKYARLFNYPVIYTDIQKVRRGWYTFEFSVLSDDPASLKTGEITQRFMKKLEDKIREHPEYYLWSHRRWKHKRDLTTKAYEG